MTINQALKRAVAALAMVAAVGCGPRAQAPSSGPAPTSATPAPAESSAPEAPSYDPTYGGSVDVADAREKEAALLKDFPQAAKREGGVLTLFSDGKAVARFTDAEAPWAFAGAFKAPTENGERVFFKVDQILFDEDGRSEMTENWFDHLGQFILFDKTLGPNPRQTMIAFGDYVGGDTQFVVPYLTLMDWTTDPKLIYKFKSPCHPIKWISDAELEAACPYVYVGMTPEADEVIPARVTRVGPRQWRLQQAGLPTRNMPTPPQTAPFDETVTAAPIAPDPERDAGLSQRGYTWLGR